MMILALALLLISLPMAAASLPDRIDPIFSPYDSTHRPGCSVAVAHEGKLVFSRGYGMANLDHDVPITPQTIFHVASISKQFAAFSVMLLADEGKLSLDDEIQKHLPEIPRFAQPITLRHLIHHTSGMRDQWTLLTLSGWRYSRDLISDDDVLEVVTRQKELNFQPGTKYLYSNTGYTLLALVVKKITGKTLREFTTEHIFRPLGMKDTHFRDNFTEIVKGQAYGYRPSDDTFTLGVTNFNTTGATSLLTTPEDLLRWSANFDDPKVGASVLNAMQTPAKLNNGEAITYAGGLIVTKYRGLKTVGHSGADAGYRADFVRFPDQKLAVACACNDGSANPSALARKVAEVFLEAQMETPPSKKVGERSGPPLIVSQSLEGVYWNEKDDAYRVFVVKDGSIYEYQGSSTRKLEAKHGGIFGPPSSTTYLDFVEQQDGAPSAVILGNTENADTTKFQRVKAAKPDINALQAFAGSYTSEEIPIPYRIYLEDGQLWVARTRNRPAPMVPLVEDRFQWDEGTLRFTRNKQGALAGFVLDAGRVTGLRFSKVN